MNTFPTRILRLCLPMMMLCACDPAREAQTFHSGRPLADAAKSLSQRYGYLISYEDPHRACACDLVDESGRQMKTGEYLAPDRRIVPRSQELLVKTRPGAVAAEVAGDLVDAAASVMPEYRFRVVESGDWAHIVPVGERDAFGRFTTHPAPLDVRITLPAEPRTDWMLIRAICDAVSSAANVDVVDASMLEMGIEGDDGPPKYTIGADNEVARDVLRRALDTIFRDRDGQVIWLLYYDASGGEYALNLVSVPKMANKKGG